MVYRDDLGAARARIEALEQRLGETSHSAKAVIELSARVRRLERQLQRPRSAVAAANIASHDADCHAVTTERDEPARFWVPFVVGVAMIAPFVALVPNGGYDGTRAAALIAWCVGWISTPAGLAVLVCQRRLGPALLVVLGVISYAVGWGWSASQGVVAWSPFG